ncbi:hypothetical protein D3C84_551970 [compost metagenome]
MQHASSHAGRAHGDGDARGEDRIEEFRCVAQQGKTRTVQGFDVGRVAANGSGFGVPHGVVQHAGQAWRLGNETAQAVVEVVGATFEMLLGGDYADRAAPVAERNGPEPDIAFCRVGGDENLGAVEVRAVDAVFDVGEHGLAHREVRRSLKLEQTRQDSAVAAGVEHELGFDGVFAAIFAANTELRLGALDIDADNGLAVTNFHALQRGLIGQQLVEISTLNLERRWFALGEGVAEIEGAVALAPGERSTGFHLETGGVDGVEHARFFDEVQAVGQQALADGKARKMLALDHQYIVTFALEQCGGDGAGRAGTDHYDLAALHFNGWHLGSLPARRLSTGFGACRSGPAAM